MPSSRYCKNAAECMDRALYARNSEDIDAWLLIAEEWLKLAVESKTPDRQPGRSGGPLDLSGWLHRPHPKASP